MIDLERELESELHRVLDPLSRVPIPARKSAPSDRMRGLVGGAGATLAFKLATGIAVAAAAVTVAGAETTGSGNPTVWGQQVEAKVETCKTALIGTNSHGIGNCVSAFANTHGQQVSNQARQHGQGSRNSNHGTGSGQGAGGSSTGQGNKGGNGKAHGKGASSSPGNAPQGPGGKMSPGPPPGS